MPPPLPPELLAPIFHFAVTGQSPAERYRDLHTFCLVDRTWRAEAQAPLFSRVVINSSERWTSFENAVQRRPELGQTVRELRVEQNVQTGAFLDVLSHLPNLLTLQHQPNYVDYRLLRLELRPSLLKRATLSYSFLFDLVGIFQAVPLYLNCLRYLELVQSRGRDTFAPVFKNHSLLFYNAKNLRGAAMPLSLLPDAVQVIPHLPILCAVTWQDFVDSMPPWRALHGQVRHLHILPISYAPPPHYLDELTTRVRRDPTLSALEVLYLPTAWRGIGTAEGKAEWERVRDERSVEVEYEDEEEVAFPLDGWGRMLGAFRRRCEAKWEEKAE